MSRTIVQDVTIAAKPGEVSKALTDSSQFSRLTGNKEATIDNSSGGAFSLFDGMVTGTMIENVPGQRLVQVWRAGNWPEGAYSLITFNLQAKGGNTSIHFEQHGHPAEAEEHLMTGWHKMYWEPLMSYFAA